MFTFSLITTDAKWAARTGATVADPNPSRNPKDKHVRYVLDLPVSAYVRTDKTPTGRFMVVADLPVVPKDFPSSRVLAPDKWCSGYPTEGRQS